MAVLGAGRAARRGGVRRGRAPACPCSKQAVEALQRGRGDHLRRRRPLLAGCPADQIAGLLERVGVGTVRGFSTNVSNYQPTEAEATYAATLSTLLGDAHYVIDTGRNGIGDGDRQRLVQPAGPGARPASRATSTTGVRWTPTSG